MTKNVFKILAVFILGVGGGIFADQILWPYFIERPLFYQYRLEQAPVYVTEIKEVVIQENTALKNAVEKVEKAVAGIRTKTKGGKVYESSGLIATSDGLVVALSDLVPANSIYSVFINGEQLAGQVLKRDLKDNLVLVKVDKKNLSTAGFGDLGRIKLGERVFLVGTIFEKDKTRKFVNEGAIRIFDENTIETNIAEKKSGASSVLFDIEGNVLGINFIDSEGRVKAVPVPKVRNFLGF